VAGLDSGVARGTIVRAGEERLVAWAEGRAELHEFPADLRAAARDFLRLRSVPGRLAEIAAERAVLGPETPELPLVAAPVASREAGRLLPGKVNFGLVFGGEQTLFQETVAAVAADGRLAGAEEINVLGVRDDWGAEEGVAREALVADGEGVVRRMQFRPALKLHVVEALDLRTAAEVARHQELSAAWGRLGLGQVNPARGAERADRKFLAHQLWLNAPDGPVETPRVALIPEGSSAVDAAEALRLFAAGWGRGMVRCAIVLMPDTGTEGRGVRCFDLGAGEIGPGHPAVEYAVRELLAHGDVLVRERRGNTLTRATSEGETGPARPVAFRVNVAWDGEHFVAESGYAQVAASPGMFVASRGRGGEIVNINRALRSLCWVQGSAESRLVLSEAEVQELRRTAERAARALNVGLGSGEMLGHMGVDLLLEVVSGPGGQRLQWVVLEANARPAGLNHATEIVGPGRECERVLSSLALFESFRVANLGALGNASYEGTVIDG